MKFLSTSVTVCSHEIDAFLFDCCCYFRLLFPRTLIRKTCLTLGWDFSRKMNVFSRIKLFFQIIQKSSQNQSSLDAADIDRAYPHPLIINQYFDYYTLNTFNTRVVCKLEILFYFYKSRESDLICHVIIP